MEPNLNLSADQNPFSTPDLVEDIFNPTVSPDDSGGIGSRLVPDLDEIIVNTNRENIDPHFTTPELIPGVSSNNTSSTNTRSQNDILTGTKHQENLVGEVVFIDETVENYESLIAGVDDNASIFILDSERDGILQISQVLEQFDEVTAVHIVSHGNEGLIQLGSTELSQDNLAEYADDLTSWGLNLHEDADLIFYGCNVASGTTGKNFLQQISQLTRADIIASDDLTGHQSQGGDWDLEYRIGNIQATSIVSSDFSGLLATTSTSGSTLTITGTASDDNINIGFSNGSLTVDGTATSIASITAITINGGVGKDTVNFGSNLNIPGINLTVNSETINVTANIDTRKLDSSNNTNGNAGNISFTGNKISLTNANLLAQTPNGSAFTPGNISLISSNLGQSKLATTGVTISNGSIQGGNVTLRSASDASNTYDGAYDDGTFLGALEEVFDGLDDGQGNIFNPNQLNSSGLSAPIFGFARANATAKVDITGTSNINASNLTIASSSTTRADVDPWALQMGLAISYGESNPDAQVRIGNGVNINTTGDASITSNAKSSMLLNSVALGFGSWVGNNKVQLTSTAGQAQIISKAQIDSGASLNVGGDFNLNSGSQKEHSLNSTAWAVDDGVLGTGVTVSLVDNLTQALMDGNLQVAGASTNIGANAYSLANNATSATFVGAKNSLPVRLLRLLTPTGFTGAKGGLGSLKEATFRANTQVPSAISGALVYGEQTNTIEAHLGDNSLVQVAGNLAVLADNSDRPNFNANAEVKSSERTGAKDKPNTSKIVIARAGGTAVNLANVDNNVKAFIGKNASVDASGSIKVESEAIVPIENDPLKILGLHPEQLQGFKLVNRQQINPQTNVNDSLNRITFETAHGFNNGDQVTYTADGKAIGGLVSGQGYQVSKIDDFTIGLRSINNLLNFQLDNNQNQASTNNKITLDTNLNRISFTQPHQLKNNQEIIYKNTANANRWGLTVNTSYFVELVNDKTIRLKTKNTDGSIGNVVVLKTPIDSNSTETHTFNPLGDLINLDSTQATGNQHIFTADRTEVTLSTVTKALDLATLKLSPEFTSAAQAKASASNLSVAGSLNYFNLTNNSNAYIDEGASINQNGSYRSNNQQVTVKAKSEVATINWAGDFDPVADLKQFIVNKSSALSTLFGGIAETAETGIGVGITVSEYNIATKAEIKDRVQINATNLDVIADTYNLSVSTAASGSFFGQSDKQGATGSASVVDFDNLTLAHIDDGAIVKTTNNLKVDAQDRIGNYNIGGAIAKAGATALGATVVINEIDRNTQAVIGGYERPLSFNPQGTISFNPVFAPNEGVVEVGDTFNPNGDIVVGGGYFDATTAVNTTSNTITLQNHGLSTGDTVIYRNDAALISDGTTISQAGADIGGLTDFLSYYVIKVDQNTIKLAATEADAKATTPKPINFTSQGGGKVHSISRLTLDTTSDRIYINQHGFKTGDTVVYSSGNGTDISGLTTGNTYYVIVDSADAIRIATTSANATATTPVAVDFKNTGAGGFHSFRAPRVDLATNHIVMEKHGFQTGDAIIYNNGGDTNIGGLSNGTTYYAIADANNRDLLKLATSRANALSGTAIPLTSKGSGVNHSFAEVRVNTADDSLWLGNHRLVTGDTVIYSNGGGTDVGGLSNGTRSFALTKNERHVYEQKQTYHTRYHS